MTSNPVGACVERLVEARRTGTPASSAAAPLPDAAAAYGVQQAVASRLGWFTDAAPRHWKSGGASRDAVLTHAPLPAHGVWSSGHDASAWPFRLRLIEAEIALRLARDVSPAYASEALDIARANALIDAMCVSIEVVDSRWAEGVDAPVMAKLADLQSHGALVLGAWAPFAPRDWSTQRCRVQIGQRPPIERTGSHALADPLFVLPAWLRHATRDGATVAAGTVVTTGTWVGMLPAAAGDLVRVDFAGIGDATLQL